MATEVLMPTQNCVLNSFRFHNRPNPKTSAKKQKNEGKLPKPKKERLPKPMREGSPKPPQEPTRNSVPICTVMISKSGVDLDRKKKSEEEKKAMKEGGKLMSQLRKAAKRVVFAGHVAPLPPSPRKLPQPGFIRGGASKVSPLNI